MSRRRYYDPPEDPANTVFDPADDTFGPIMAAIQAGEFGEARNLLDALTSDPELEEQLHELSDTYWETAKSEDHEWYDAAGGEIDGLRRAVEILKQGEGEPK